MTDLWKPEVELVKKARIDAQPLASSRSLVLQEVAKGIVGGYGDGKNGAIVNGSVNWGYAKENSDIDIHYIPRKYGTLGKLLEGSMTVINTNQRFNDTLLNQGYKSDVLGFYCSMRSLRKDIKKAKKTGEVTLELRVAYQEAQIGMVIGEGLRKVIDEMDEMRESFSPEQLKKARLDKLFEFLTPVRSSIRKLSKDLQERGHSIPESIIVLDKYLKKYGID